jgi:lipopolysaccharide biosynthesis protein
MGRAPNVGLIGPAAHILPLSEYMGANARDVSMLAARMRATAYLGDSRFISGSMFWARLAALKPLLELDLLESEFVEEHGQTDGTMAHAVERVIGISSVAAGYRLESVESLLDEPVPPIPRHYTFAHRS